MISAVPNAEQKHEPPKAAGKKLTAPYFDLAQSIEVARTIQNRGGGLCGLEHLAEWLGYKSSRSGTFFARLQAAKMFGLIHNQAGGVAPTERALTIMSPVMPDDEARAKFDAFTAVPLFNAVFEKLKNAQLPPEVGIKNLLKTQFGVPPDREIPTYRIMMDSADEAGLFRTAGDRSKMIKPNFGSAPPAQEAPKPQQERGSADADQRVERPKFYGGGGSGPEGPAGVHTAIVGLLRELPPSGSLWTASKKQNFLEAFKAVINVLYPDSEGGQP